MHLSATLLTILTYISLIYSKNLTDHARTAQKLRKARTQIDNTQSDPSSDPTSQFKNGGLSDRIINGAPADIKNFPFVVQLYAQIGANSKICGGTLIAPNLVVTAAHCLLDSNQKLIDVINFSVSAGSIGTIQTNKNVYKPSKLLVHPQYDDSTSANDIGLIILSQEIPANIAVPTKIYNGQISDDISVVAAGWGALANGTPVKYSSVLNYINVKVSSSQKCAIYDPLWKGNNGYEICTEVVDGKDTCYGDSGGPLIATVSTLMPLVGVTSGGVVPGFAGNPPCGIQGGFTYYTSVRYFADWISTVTNLPLSQLLYVPQPTPLPQKPTIISQTSKATATSSSKVGGTQTTTQTSISTRAASAIKTTSSTKAVSTTKVSSMLKTTKTTKLSKATLKPLKTTEPTKPTKSTTVNSNSSKNATTKTSNKTKVSGTSKSSTMPQTSKASTTVSKNATPAKTSVSVKTGIPTATKTSTYLVPLPTRLPESVPKDISKPPNNTSSFVNNLISSLLSLFG